MQRNTKRLPLWETVLVDLRTRVESGEFAERFHSDRELMNFYGVSRHTVREAVRRLDAVDRRPRVGGWLRPTRNVLHSLTSTLTALGVQTTSVRNPQCRRRSRDIAERLGRSAGVSLALDTATLLADDVPLIFTELWSAARDSIAEKEITALLSVSASTPDSIQVRTQQTLPALPDSTVCRKLGIPAGTATFCIEETLEIANGHPAWQRSYVRADRYPCILQFATK